MLGCSGRRLVRSSGAHSAVGRAAPLQPEHAPLSAAAGLSWARTVHTARGCAVCAVGAQSPRAALAAPQRRMWAAQAAPQPPAAAPTPPPRPPPRPKDAESGESGESGGGEGGEGAGQQEPPRSPYMKYLLAALGASVVVGIPFGYAAQVLEDDDEMREWAGEEYPRVVDAIKSIVDIDARRPPKQEGLIQSEALQTGFLIMASGRVLTMQKIAAHDTLATLQARAEAGDFDDGVPIDDGDYAIDVCFVENGRMPARIREPTSDELRQMLADIEESERELRAVQRKLGWFDSEARTAAKQSAATLRDRRKLVQDKLAEVLAAEAADGGSQESAESES